MSGWIKLHRSLLKNPFYGDSEAVHLWVTLLLLANHADYKKVVRGQMIEVKQGELLTSRDSLSLQTGIKTSKIERLLTMFQSEQQIGQRKTRNYRVISITCWRKYQIVDSETDNGRTTDEHDLRSKELLRSKALSKTDVSDPVDDGVPDTQTEDESDIPKKQKTNGTNPKIKYSQVVDAYNRICTPTLPKCVAITTKRRANIQRLVSTKIGSGYPFQDIGFWEVFFVECLNNPHWVGRNERGWKADIEFLTRHDNAMKALETSL